MDPDVSVRHAGSRFNVPVPCECGLPYCNGWAIRRTRLRHLATANEHLMNGEDVEEPGKSVVKHTYSCSKKYADKPYGPAQHWAMKWNWTVRFFSPP
jgi:hypothetical protein